MNNRACRIAINPKNDGYWGGLATMVCDFFDKEIGTGVNANEVKT